MIIHGEQLFNPKLKREVAYDRRRQFTKDGKRLMLPASYQEAEKVFGFDEKEIEWLNSNSGGNETRLFRFGG